MIQSVILKITSFSWRFLNVSRSQVLMENLDYKIEGTKHLPHVNRAVMHIIIPSALHPLGNAAADNIGMFPLAPPTTHAPRCANIPWCKIRTARPHPAFLCLLTYLGSGFSWAWTIHSHARRGNRAQRSRAVQRSHGTARHGDTDWC